MLENKTKICIKCHIEKELNEFRFRNDSKNHRSDCKECCSQVCKEYREANKSKIVEYRKNYRQANRQSMIEKDKAYYQINKEKATKTRRAYYVENRDSIIKRTKYYYENNKKQIYQKTREYLQTPKGKAMAKNIQQRRRSIKKIGDVTTTQMLELQNNAKICYWCSIPLKGKNMHIDHYVPLSKGGEHTLSNLVVSCSTCNQKKNAKDPILFANSIGRLI